MLRLEETAQRSLQKSNLDHRDERHTSIIDRVKKFYRNEYVTMKQQWQSITPQQEKNFSLLRERKHLVGRLETGGE